MIINKCSDCGGDPEIYVGNRDCRHVFIAECVGCKMSKWSEIKGHEIKLWNEENPILMDNKKYSKEIRRGVFVDVYDVLKAFGVTCPAVQHAIKKQLAPGKRGHKSAPQDLLEAIESLERAIELLDIDD